MKYYNNEEYIDFGVDVAENTLKLKQKAFQYVHTLHTKFHNCINNNLYALAWKYNHV